MVPGGGIEPPTRGFSVHCSTPELPGHGWNGRAVRVAQVLVAGRSQVQREFGCDSVWFCAAFAQSRGKLSLIIAAVQRHRVSAREQFAQINIRAALRAKWVVAFATVFRQIGASSGTSDQLAHRCAGAFSLQLKMAKRRPACKRGFDRIGAKRARQHLFPAAPVFLGHRRQIKRDLPA